MPFAAMPFGAAVVREPSSGCAEGGFHQADMPAINDAIALDNISGGNDEDFDL